MLKNKAETSSQRKVKTNNGISKQSTKVSSSSRNEEVKKSREPSTDRSNVKKSLTTQKTTKKVESSRPKVVETPKTRTVSNNGTNRTSVSKTVSKSNANVSSVTPRTSVSKTTVKPVKAPAIATPTSVSSSRSTTNIMKGKGTKSSSRDVTSKRVTKEQYFPKKFPFSSYLHENEEVNSDKKVINTEQKTNTKSIKKVVEESPPPKIKRERTMTRVLSPSEVKVIQNIVAANSEISSSSDNRPRTATIRKHYDDSDNIVHNEKLSIDLSLNENNALKNDENNASKTGENIASKNDENIASKNDENIASKNDENIASKNDENIASNNDENIASNNDENIALNNDEKIASNNDENNASNKEDSSEEPDYEDDFDSYESDFEACSSTSSPSPSDIEISTSSDSTSSSSSEEKLIELTQKRTSSAGTEEERKLDSGNYDLPDIKHKQILDKIKEAVERENSNLNKISNGEVVSNLASLSDEGFEEGSKHSLVNTGFVNFMDAKKKQKQKKLNLKSRKRGDDLMEMIRLNKIYFSVFDMKAISYDEFMQSYGKSGTIQVSSQTGDDDIDEEIQTENIEMLSKSTQFPIRFSKEEYFTEEHLNTENELTWKCDAATMRKLNKFMETTGRLVLNILEQKQIKSEQITTENERELPFSEGYFSLHFDSVPFLKDRNIIHMSYSNYSRLLTVHESNIQVHMNPNSQLLSRSTICVWDICEPAYPLHILVSSGDIIKACFDSNHGFLIFAGICDGSICVWDLRENAKLHPSIYDEKTDKSHYLRSPTYTTVTSIDGERNSTKIIAIQSYFENINENTNQFVSHRNISGIQVATLDESGLIVIWSVIQKQATPELLSEDQGLIPWGCVLLVQGLTIDLQKLNPRLDELQCFDLQFCETDFNHLYIASNYGVLHCLTSGMKPKPKIYSSNKSAVCCVEMCPFSPIHFLSGCENGNIKLHSRFYEKPLMTLCSTDERNKIDDSIQIIEWSNSRPCVFFIKDKAKYIHIWDLTASDMYPIYSIPFAEDISDIKFLSSLNSSNQSCYLAIASKNYGVRIHTVSEEFSQISADRYKTELNIFLNYANRL